MHSVLPHGPFRFKDLLVEYLSFIKVVPLSCCAVCCDYLGWTEASEMDSDYLDDLNVCSHLTDNYHILTDFPPLIV